jgi:hypothetical protein
MDETVNPDAEQRRICGVNNRIDFQARDVADRQMKARFDIGGRSHVAFQGRGCRSVCAGRYGAYIFTLAKKDRSRHAGSGQVAGGKPATGRLCQAGLKKMKAGVRHPAYPTNRRANRLFQPQADGLPGYAAR